MRSATVVLPVPGLPVKLMCSVGVSCARPSCFRARSTSSSAAVSRMRFFTGSSPISSRSSSSSTAATPDSSQLLAQVDARLRRLRRGSISTLAAGS